MSIAGEAGRSASERAAELHRKAARSEIAAQRYEQGALGERRTAAALEPQGDAGWKIFHDLRVPGSRANRDHVVVTPAGVWVIDSKHWSTPAREWDGMIWTGRYPKRDEVERLAGAVAIVHRMLGSHPTPVRGVMSMTGAVPAGRLVRSGDVVGVGVAELVSYLSSFPPVLGAADIDMIARTFASGLPPRTKEPPPAWAPQHRTTPPWLTSTHTSRSPDPRQPAERVRRASVQAKTAPSRSRSRGWPLLGSLLCATLTLFGGLIAFLVIDAGVHAMKHQLLASIPTTTAPAPTALALTWSCPSRSLGWTATVAWPASATPPFDWEVETAMTADGPWTVSSSGFTGHLPEVTHLLPGRSEWVEAGATDAMVTSGSPLTRGEVVAPAGC